MPKKTTAKANEPVGNEGGKKKKTEKRTGGVELGRVDQRDRKDPETRGRCSEGIRSAPIPP